MNIKQFKDLPDTPGVYYFLGNKKQILYIGKATSLRDRVKSYFTKDLLLTRGPLIEKMIREVREVRFVRTDSVLEAMMLEVAEIKKHQPFYNSREKDDKSYNYVVITKEDFPRVLVIRGREIPSEKLGNSSRLTRQNPTGSDATQNLPNFLSVYGPFPNSSELREALRIIRKIFPHRTTCEPCEALAKKGRPCKPCFNAQIGLCPGVCSGVVGKQEYRKTIKHLKMFFEGNKPKLVETLEKEMNTLAKKQKFEEAEKVKRTLYALEHIADVAMIKADMSRRNFGGLTRHSRAPTPTEISSGSFRLEAYDIAHFGGKETVGVMTVVVDGELDKSQYRKFKVKGLRSKGGNDDTGNLKEVLTRRLGHLEWSLPNLIVVDGGVAQINAAKEVLKERGFNIDLVSVVKDEKHKPKEVVGSKKYVVSRGREILLANAEAHRFAIKYHRKLRHKGFRI